MKKKYSWGSWVMALFIVLCSASCGDDSPKKQGKLSKPVVVQAEEVLDNPISLSFAWKAVEDARKYVYRLEKMDGDESEVIAQGNTAELNVSFTHEEGQTLSFDSNYKFSVQALPNVNGMEASDFAEAEATTSSGKLPMVVSSPNYRTMTFSVKPTDKSMLYDMGSTSLERYEQAASDEAFINDMVFGYYKAIAMQTGANWVDVMKTLMREGNATGNNYRLTPGTDEIAFAVGVKFVEDEDPNDPVKIITQLVVKKVTTPGWTVTDNTTFQVSDIKGELDDNGKLVLNAHITPSNALTRYYVAYVPNSQFSYYKSDIDLLASYIVANEDQHVQLTNGEKINWAFTDWLNTGEKTISSIIAEGLSWNVKVGEPFTVLVCGLDKDGLVTTEISKTSHPGFSEEELQ